MFITRVLGYFPLSDHLYEYFQHFLKFMTIRAMTDHVKLPTEGEIRARRSLLLLPKQLVDVCLSWSAGFYRRKSRS